MKDPNLQNTPIRTEHGKRIREAFIATGNVTTVDYASAELRIVLEQLERDIEYVGKKVALCFKRMELSRALEATRRARHDLSLLEANRDEFLKLQREHTSIPFIEPPSGRFAFPDLFVDVLKGYPWL